MNLDPKSFLLGVVVTVLVAFVACGLLVNSARRQILDAWDRDQVQWARQCEGAMDRGVEMGRRLERLERLELLATVRGGALVR